MRRRSILNLSLLLSSVAGCASPPQRTAGETLLKIVRDKRVVALAYFVHKRIEYMDEQFLHENHQGADFGVAWQATRDMSDRLSTVLTKNNVRSVTLSSLLGAEEAELIIDKRIAPLASGVFDGTPWSDKLVNAMTSDYSGLSAKIEESRADYIFELIITQLKAASPIGVDANLVCFVCLRLTDARSGDPILMVKAMPMLKQRIDGKDIKRAIEANNLFLLRDFVGRTIDAMPRFNVVDLRESIYQISSV